MIDQINHIGIVVTDIEKVVEQFCKSLGKPVVPVKSVPEAKKKVALIPFENCSIELIEDNNEENNMRGSAPGEHALIHHFSFTSEDIAGDMAELEKNGCTPLAEKPRTGLRGRQILFYKDSALGIPIELSD